MYNSAFAEGMLVPRVVEMVTTGTQCNSCLHLEEATLQMEATISRTSSVSSKHAVGGVLNEGHIAVPSCDSPITKLGAW